MTSDPMLKDIGKVNGLQLWRVNKFKLVPVPKNEYGTFYTGDSYVALNQRHGGAWDVHFWIGNDSTSDEYGAAAYKSYEIDMALGGLPTQYRETQSYETPLFISYFPDGMRYVSGGMATGYKHVEDDYADWKPKLYHCKGKRNVRSTQVDCKIESLNLGDVFLLDLGRNIYVWMPPDSGRLERIKGMQLAKNMAHVVRQGDAQVHILDNEWDTDETFWSHFGGVSARRKVAKAGDDDENFWKRMSEQITLWKVSDSSGKLNVTKVAQGDVKHSQLDSNDAFILDALNGGVFVWIGKNCTSEERAKAMKWGEDYIKQKHLPSWTQVTKVLDTAENNYFTQWFTDWTDTKKKNSFQPLLFQVSDESGRLRVEEIANYTQEDLDGDDVMIMDALNLIYVWVGANANKNEKKEAENTANKYLAMGKLPRHKKTTIETIFQGKEPATFKKFFPTWNEELFKDEARSVANMRKLLFK